MLFGVRHVDVSELGREVTYSTIWSERTSKSNVSLPADALGSSFFELWEAVLVGATARRVVAERWRCGSRREAVVWLERARKNTRKISRQCMFDENADKIVSKYLRNSRDSQNKWSEIDQWENVTERF